MRRDIENIARKTIPEPDWNKIKVGGSDGMTEDIISEIVRTNAKGINNLKAFAPKLVGNSIEETLLNDWTFVRNYIKYQLDPDGLQYIKTPSRVFWDGEADCKGFSLFIVSLLKNQGFKKFGFRFVSYSDSRVFTHVYVWVEAAGKNFILDAVPGIPYFNYEKPYKHKKDLNMTQIIAMSGLGENANKVKKVMNTGNRMPDEMSEGELTLWIARDRMITEKQISEKLRGIGNLNAEKYQDSIDMLEDAIEAVQDATVNGIGSNGGQQGRFKGKRIDAYKLNSEYIWGVDQDIEDELLDIADMAVSGVYSNADVISGIGGKDKRKKRKAKRKDKKAARKEVRKEKKQLRKAGDKTALKNYKKAHRSQTGKFLKKVGKSVKKGLKAVTKVLSAPQRAFVKLLLEIYLPKAAPVFLYLFINDPKLIAKLPPVALEKRKKAEKQANFIVNTVGMKRAHFMGIVRNGIMKEYGKSPEKVISEQMRGMAGIGAAAILASAFGFLMKIIGKLGSLFKKRPEEMPDEESFLPDPGSEDEFSYDVADNIKDQSSDIYDEDGDEIDNEDKTGGKSIWNSLG